jgi:hypothetical protein
MSKDDQVRQIAAIYVDNTKMLMTSKCISLNFFQCKRSALVALENKFSGIFKIPQFRFPFDLKGLNHKVCKTVCLSEEMLVYGYTIRAVLADHGHSFGRLELFS